MINTHGSHEFHQKNILVQCKYKKAKRANFSPLETQKSQLEKKIKKILFQNKHI